MLNALKSRTVLFGLLLTIASMTRCSSPTCRPSMSGRWVRSSARP